MITKTMLNAIKQNDVSKNKELTKERVESTWQSISKEMRKKIADYDISAATLKRTRDMGNISVKVAAALALISGYDPYYFTAEVDQNNIPADENRIIEFIKEKGYEEVLKITDEETDTKKRGRKSKTIKKEVELLPPFQPEPNIAGEADLAEPETGAELFTIEEFAEKQMANLPDDKKEALYKLPEDQVTGFLQTLEQQALYSDRAKNLLGLLRLILIR